MVAASSWDLGERFDLVCDDGEAVAGLAGGGGFDGGVERQQVGLVGDVVDDVDDFVDALDALAEGFDVVGDVVGSVFDAFHLSIASWAVSVVSSVSSSARSLVALTSSALAAISSTVAERPETSPAISLVESNWSSVSVAISSERSATVSVLDRSSDTDS